MDEFAKTIKEILLIIGSIGIASALDITVVNRTAALVVAGLIVLCSVMIKTKT